MTAPSTIRTSRTARLGERRDLVTRSVAGGCGKVDASAPLEFLFSPFAHPIHPTLSTYRAPVYPHHYPNASLSTADNVYPALQSQAELP